MRDQENLEVVVLLLEKETVQILNQKMKLHLERDGDVQLQIQSHHLPIVLCNFSSEVELEKDDKYLSLLNKLIDANTFI
jgi:hypothetical protein